MGDTAADVLHERSTTSSWRGPAAMLVAAALGIACLYAMFASSAHDERLLKNRLHVDNYDLNVYYKSSRWVAGEGTLYREVHSEYPLLANGVFGAVRGVAVVVGVGLDDRTAFYWVWASAAWCLYLGTLYTIATRVSRGALWLWLAPAPLYFALYRFDLVPAVLTLYALLALRDGRDLWGMVWMSLALAAKGYALFFMPSLFVYLCYRRGFVRAALLCGVCLAPWLLSHAVIYAFAGLEGVKMPYRFHARRQITDQSTFGVLAYLLGWPELMTSRMTHHAAKVILVLSALIPAALRPRTFDQLVHALLFTTVGFITATVFYSPQFVLWVLPMASLSASRWVRGVTIAFAWASYLHFPLLFRTALAKPTFAVGAALRAALMAAALPGIWSTRPPAAEGAAPKAPLAVA